MSNDDLQLKEAEALIQKVKAIPDWIYYGFQGLVFGFGLVMLYFQSYILAFILLFLGMPTVVELAKGLKKVKR